ncbi:MAG TPA: type II toxin-antitoxin system RelE/ParE family toxin [Allocoleopsis sp.]
MKYVFHPDALTEYSETVQYYVQQRKDLAQAFIDAVEDAVYRLREYPNRYPVIEDNIHRCLTRKFPYVIVYSMEKDYILILAVMHSNRSPNYWKYRLR